MADDVWTVVPEDRRGAAQEAIVAAFGRASVTALTPLTGGISARNYRVDVGGRPYVLRLEGARGGMRDPARSYPCLTAAAEAGVAPRVHHADAAAGVAIVDFLPSRPLGDYPGGPVALAAELGRLIGRLQSTPAFPPYADFATLLGRMIGFLRAAPLFAPGLLDAHAEGFERLRAAYPWAPAALVSSHNDPNPRNLIFDGERLWLIDWETAFANDPFVDLAIITSETAVTPELETALLEAWAGGPAGAEARARLALMKPMTRLYYAGILLAPFAMAPPAEPFQNLAAPTPDEFTRAIAEGRLRMGSPDLTFAMGKMFLAGFLGLLAAPEAAEAMAR